MEKQPDHNDLENRLTSWNGKSDHWLRLENFSLKETTRCNKQTNPVIEQNLAEENWI